MLFFFSLLYASSLFLDMFRHSLPYWKKAPFIRVLAALTSGILLQFYFPQQPVIINIVMLVNIVALTLFGFLPLRYRYALRYLQGALLLGCALGLGMQLTWQKDDRHHSDWYGHFYQENDALIVQVDEQPVEKTKTYKAEARVLALVRGGKMISCKGRVLLYISKDSLPAPHFADRLMVKADLQPIKNSGNPGAFNYRRYAAFRQLYHSVFLKKNNSVVLRHTVIPVFRNFLYEARSSILDVLRRYAASEKDGLGIAEALLIGYTQDLDKDLVQAYSNTGVVHVIAISGMHLGLIYVLLLGVCSRIPILRRIKWLQWLITLSALWLFSLLTGGSASVLRAAVMFSCISTGKLLMRQAGVYNAIAASAFILLCYNPFYLWDVGFQLSYLAVLGILIFQRTIYRSVYISNKWLDKVWELAAVSLAAQVLTFPVCLYYFHQFPNLFLLCNLIIVPLSGIILYAEILLLLLAWIPMLAHPVGRICSLLVSLMNRLVLWFNDIPFAVWNSIPATLATTLFLYAAILLFTAGFFKARKQYFYYALLSLLSFLALQGWYRMESEQQLKLVIYQVPKYRAMDFIRGRQYIFSGDSSLQKEGLLQQFHLKPARTSMQVSETKAIPGCLVINENIFFFAGKTILLVTGELNGQLLPGRLKADLVILSGGSRMSLAELTAVVDCGLIVVDASVKPYRAGQWQKESLLLNLRFHNIASEGAFVYEP